MKFIKQLSLLQDKKESVAKVTGIKKAILNSDKTLNEKELRLLMLIPEGKENPIPLKQLEQILGMQRRNVGKLARHLLDEHQVPVGGSRDSKNGGYYIATNWQEAREIAQGLLNQARDILKRRKSFLKACKKWFDEKKNVANNS